MIVSGAYGRKYATAKEAKADWNDGKDFIIRDIFSGPGRYVNKIDAQRAGARHVEIRFGPSLSKVTSGDV
jgi:hypothetical protein